MTTKYATMTVANCEADAEIARLRTAARHLMGALFRASDWRNRWTKRDLWQIYAQAARRWPDLAEGDE